MIETIENQSLGLSMKVNKDLAKFMFNNIIFFSERNLRKNGIFAFKFTMKWAEDFFQESQCEIVKTLSFLIEEGLLQYSRLNHGDDVFMMSPQEISEYGQKTINGMLKRNKVLQ